VKNVRKPQVAGGDFLTYTVYYLLSKLSFLCLDIDSV